MFKRLPWFVGWVWCCWLATFSVLADTVSLSIGLIRAGGQDYFVDLLEQSLLAAGHQPDIEVKGNLPQKRMLHMIAHNQLSLTWLVQSDERDRIYVPVEVGITNGLIGHRILLISPGQESVYSQVKTLDDFRNLELTGVFGSGWFDVHVWKHNQLRFVEKDGGWQSKVYRQIASRDRGVDYFSRGFFEVLDEARAHPEVVIEPRLMLVYDRDFRFYLSRDAARYKLILEDALRKAKASGLMQRLMEKHWADAFALLKPGSRLQLRLQNPPR